MAMTPDTLTQRGEPAVGPPSAPAFGSGEGGSAMGGSPRLPANAAVVLAGRAAAAGALDRQPCQASGRAGGATG
jgi:hypothetical protein